MESPDFCQHCSWKPVIPNNENQEIAIENQWLVIPIPNSAIWLYVCPACHCVMANKNCIENIKKIKEFKKNQIVQPKSNIIDIHGRNIRGRN